MKLIGVKDAAEDDQVFLPELKQYMEVCCRSLRPPASSTGSTQPVFLVYLEYDEKFKPINHRDSDNLILAYVYPQSMVVNLVGEVKFGNKPLYIIPASSAGHMANLTHQEDFIQKQGASLRAANIGGVLKGEAPNSFANAAVENQMNFLKDLLTQHTAGETASPGKAFFLNATIVRSGIGLADEKSEYGMKKPLLDYQEAAKRQKLRVHNADEIAEQKKVNATAHPALPPKPVAQSNASPKTESREQISPETNVSKILDSMSGSNKLMRVGYKGGDDLGSYYEELGIKRDSGTSTDESSIPYTGRRPQERR